MSLGASASILFAKFTHRIMTKQFIFIGGMSMETLKNKIYAFVLVGIGVAATFLLEEGIGVLIFMLMFTVPLFFGKKNWIVD